MLSVFHFSVLVFFSISLRFANEMPTIKEFESLFDSKLQPIQSKLDDLVKQMNDNYMALHTKLDLLEARNASLEAETTNFQKKYLEVLASFVKLGIMLMSKFYSSYTMPLFFLFFFILLYSLG